MKKNVKTSEITEVYNILSKAKLTKMETQEKFGVVRTLGQLKSAATDFEDFRKEAHERLRPEDFEEIKKKVQAFDSLSEKEKMAVNKAVMDYDKAVADCIAEEAEREQEVEVHTLSEDAFGRFMDSNPELQAEVLAAVLNFMEI